MRTTKNERLHIRVEPSVKRLLRKAARRRRTSMTEFVVDAAKREAFDELALEEIEEGAHDG